ncbi:hypothetical protein [Rhodoferax aquaticus]|uniref:Uncharacterized protein n=1 Tax=Rhodoferax aquaticus TaxID=2527691 RepID=A0A515EQG6_9BURK|nr:hypothetical protein [Rhodoferax aquaticus]QDL54897.1 hypothetical protein EXZ61_12395 [Rhodoferax aquaticus]
MKTHDLCQSLLKDACEDNISFYRGLIEKEPLDAVKDEHWRKVIALARTLTPEQRETLLQFARQSAIDAISTICGAIDGSTQLGGEFLSLSLVDGDGQQHTGALQDEFLSLVERREA